MSKRFIPIFFITLVIVTITVVAILIAKGYRYDQQTGTLKGTGIISVNAVPSGAVLYLDGQLYSASNNTINDLSPKTYHLKVVKDNYTSWEKDVLVEAEKVSQVTLILFPSTPDLLPLTFSGVVNPQVSPDGQKIVYAVTDPNKAGLWALDLSNRPFVFSRAPQQIAEDSSLFSFSKSTFSWTPDSKSILVKGATSATQIAAAKNVNYLLDANRLNSDPSDISSTIAQIQAGWQSDLDLKNKDLLSRLPTQISSQINTVTAKWSPDSVKVSWSEKDGTVKVYDTKKKLTYTIGKPKDFVWFPDSLHMVLVEDGSISIDEIDGTNKMTIYGGTFEKGLVFPWPDGSKLTILASFNKGAPLNLYSIDLR